MKFNGEINANDEKSNLIENEEEIYPIYIEEEKEDAFDAFDYMYVSNIHKYARILIVPLFIGIISIMVKYQ